MSPKTLGGIGLIFAGLSLAHGMKTTSSLWPGVALFCLSGLLACVAACIEAAAESAKHEAELDAKAEDARVSALEAQIASLTTGGKLNSMATKRLDKEVEAIAAKVEHLEKKDALNALG